MGGVVTVASVAMALVLATALLARPPLDAAPLEPTLIILTAPPTAVPSATPLLPTPSPVPTFTPIPTPDAAIAPAVVTSGYYAVVANTDGVGVVIRGGPSTSNAQITIADEGAVLLVLDGPVESNDLLWWQVRLADGTEGWAAGLFLEPAAAP
jgi:hypothetical protein